MSGANIPAENPRLDCLQSLSLSGFVMPTCPAFENTLQNAVFLPEAIHLHEEDSFQQHISQCPWREGSILHSSEAFELPNYLGHVQ